MSIKNPLQDRDVNGNTIAWMADQDSKPLFPEEIEEEEQEVCDHCGNTQETGACFYCKMD